MNEKSLTTTTTTTSTTSSASGRTDFDALVDATLRTLASSRSQRVYEQTYRAWRAWTDEMKLDAVDDLVGANVAAFLESQAVTKSTRQRQLSALRTLAEVLSIVDYQNSRREAARKSVQMTKTPTAGVVTKERSKKALTPQEAARALTAWGGSSNRDLRNSALLAVLLTSGLRVSEAVALRWQDVDVENGVLHVAHGKGDKARDAALFGETAIHALKAWRAALPPEREFVFCAVDANDSIGDDVAINTATAYRIVREAGERAGVGHFTPHDARRTLLTELLSRGVSLADVQAQAGHTRGETTLRYARAADARQRRQTVHLRFG